LGIAQQVETGSLATQEKAIGDWCDRNGFTLHRLFREEGQSAKTTNRPAFKEMLTFCRENKGRIHAVVVYNLSRFSRNTYDHEVMTALLMSLGIRLHSVTERLDQTSTGKFTATLLAAVAQLDNDARSERTMAGMKSTLQNGYWPFGPPLGYVRSHDGSGRLEADPVRGSLIRLAFECTGAGCERSATRCAKLRGAA
jgi:site-specific DNA recombinase